MKAALLLLLCSPAFAGPDADGFCKFQETQWNLDLHNAGGRRGAEGVRARLFHRIKDLAIDYLAADKGNPLSTRAADFLKSSTVTIRLDDLNWMRSGALTATARYDGAENAISFAVDRAVYAAPDDAFLQAQIERLKPDLPHLAPTLVHEARHARDHAAIGRLPAAPETELVAYTEETMYVWRRLQADPGYLGLDKVDAVVRSEIGYPPHTPWWNDPIDHTKLVFALQKLRKSPKGRALDSELLQYWILLHSLAGGYLIFEGNLREFGILRGETVFEFPTRTINVAAAARRYLRLVQDCAKNTKIEGLRRELDILWNRRDQERRLMDLKFSDNQISKGYFVGEIVRQKREVDALVPGQ